MQSSESDIVPVGRRRADELVCCNTAEMESTCMCIWLLIPVSFLALWRAVGDESASAAASHSPYFATLPTLVIVLLLSLFVDPLLSHSLYCPVVTQLVLRHGQSQ